MQITIQQQDIEDFAMAMGYKETILDENGDSIPNPQNKGAYAKALLKSILGKHIKRYRKEVATKTIVDNINSADIDIS